MTGCRVCMIIVTVKHVKLSYGDTSNRFMEHVLIRANPEWKNVMLGVCSECVILKKMCVKKRCSSIVAESKGS